MSFQTVYIEYLCSLEINQTGLSGTASLYL